MDRELAQKLNDLIERKFKIMFKAELKKRGVVTAWVATVVSSTGSNTTVYLPSDNTHTITKKNKTGQTLVNGDEVYLFSPTGELSNSFIAVCKDKPV